MVRTARYILIGRQAMAEKRQAAKWVLATFATETGLIGIRGKNLFTRWIVNPLFGLYCPLCLLSSLG